MDYRSSLGAQRPAHQRAVSGGSYGGHTLPKRPSLPSHLSNVRSVSQPVANSAEHVGTDREVSEGVGSPIFVKGKRDMMESPGDMEIDDGERPAKRVKTEGGEFRAEGADNPPADADMAHEITPGDAMPGLPRARPVASKMSAYRRSRFGIEPSARRAHGTDPPAIATRVPPPKKVLDFAPWTGSHHEDVLNENVVRNGYYDKVAGTNQSETNTAKTAIWPSLSQKNHAGLSALSYLYIAVMEKRQAQGKCTAPSTFRPPPRLAVQEAKRAKWLEDLADPSVSLRRLSKTIPHGIKGKLLMEQCLGKFIPLHRALWLVRGVGMHELRAFRRKGFNEAQALAGEVKWVREWTVSVTQFLQDVMAACGEPDWQRKMGYALKLSAALFSEKLLDADYYLDWIVTSLAECSTEQLPIWTVLAQAHWKALTTFGRRGRRLAEGILEHLSLLEAAASPANLQLRTRLQRLTAVLAVTHRGCLILPRMWQKYSGLLSPSCLTPESARDVAARNERLVGPLDKTPTNTRSAFLDLFETLDAIDVNLDVTELTDRCLAYIPEPAELIPALLDWSSTRYRIGYSRIYLAAAIVADVQRRGIDVDNIILEYLGNEQRMDGSSENHIQRVMNELVRLKAFSVGRYLQWIITSGALYSEQNTRATKLIAALSAEGLPKHVQSTRAMLMGRLGCADDENQFVDTFKDDLEQRLFDGEPLTTGRPLLPEHTSMSVRHGIARRLATKAIHTSKESGLSLQEFCTLRKVVEQIGDIHSLARLVSAAAQSDNCTLLATAVDTVARHALSFAAMSELNPLVDRLGEQYLVLRPNQPLDRSFILALRRLAQPLPQKASLVKLLADDLILCEQQSSLAACSPASDSVVDMHATNLDSDEDIDAVFASGNVMDEQLMQRVFSRVVVRAAKANLNTSITRICGWLDQLRSVDASKAMDTIVERYLQAVISGGSLISVAAIAGLALSGIASLDKVVSRTQEVKDPKAAGTVLSAILSSPEELALEDFESYRLQLEQKRCQIEHAGHLAKLLSASVDSNTFETAEEDIEHFVVQSSAANRDFNRQVFGECATSPTARVHLTRTLNSVLGQPGRETIDVGSMIAAATPLSVRFCTAVKYLISPGENVRPSAAEAIQQAFDKGSEVWPQLLAIADDDTIHTLREKAQNALLQSMADGADSKRQEDLDGTLDLLALTSNIDGKADSTFLSAVVERLRTLDKELAQKDVRTGGSTAPTASPQNERLTLLLRMASIAVFSAVSKDAAEAHEPVRANLLATLCALLGNEALQLTHGTIQHVADLASALSDTLPLATLTALRARLAPVEPRLDFILGASGPEACEFALATAVPVGGSTQQQRALNRHPSQQQQQQRAPRGPPPAAAQRHPGPRVPQEIKTTPFALRRWEMLSDPASTVGENDTALSLGLFGMRRV